MMLKEQIENKPKLEQFVNKADPKQFFFQKDFLDGFTEQERELLLKLFLQQNIPFYQLCTHEKNFINKTSLNDLTDLSYQLRYDFLEKVINAPELTENETKQFRILPLSDWLTYLPVSSSSILIPKINHIQNGTLISVIEPGLISYLMRSMLTKAKKEFGEFLIHGKRELTLLAILEQENKEALQYYQKYLEHRVLPKDGFEKWKQLEAFIESIIAHNAVFSNHLVEEIQNPDYFYQMITTELIAKGKKNWYQNSVGIEAYCMSKLYENSNQMESIRRK